MNIVDYILLGLLLVIGVINFIAGFSKMGLNNLVTLLKIALIVILSPMIVGALMPKLSGIVDSIKGNLAENMQFVADIIVEVVAYIIVVIVLAIVLGLIFMILKKLFRKINFSITPLKWIDRIVGFIFGVVLYGIILFAITGFLAQVPVEAMKNVFEASAVMKINPFVDLFAKYVDLSWIGRMVDMIKDITNG